MINVRIRPDGIRMDGHACRKRTDGLDLVCSAVSALTCTLINALRDVSGDRFSALTDSGQTIIEWQKLSDTGKALVDAWFLGLCAINERYNCITYT